MFKFSCAYNQSKESIVNNLSDVMASRGGTLNGNLNKGDFHFGQALGKFGGRYALTTTDIIIEISQKPLYFSEVYIKEVVSKYFERQLIGGVTTPSAEAVADIEDYELASL